MERVIPPFLFSFSFNYIFTRIEQCTFLIGSLLLYYETDDLDDNFSTKKNITSVQILNEIYSIECLRAEHNVLAFCLESKSMVLNNWVKCIFGF